MQSSGNALIGIDGRVIPTHNPFIYVAPSVNLLVTGQTTIVPAAAGGSFVPFMVILELKALTGAPVVLPIVRVGNNVNYDNICPLQATPGGFAVRNLYTIPLAGTPVSVDISTAPIKIDVQTAATMATQMTAACYILGYNFYT